MSIFNHEVVREFPKCPYCSTDKKIVKTIRKVTHHGREHYECPNSHLIPARSCAKPSWASQR